MKEVILDTETTGLSVKDGHRLVEIGCIELENLIPTKKNFHSYLNPERKVSEKALEVHGYTDEFLSNKKKFSELADKFLNFINGKRLIIHNAEFDLSHLNNELKIIGKEPIKNEVIDTLVLAKDKFPGSSVSLDALCKRYGIDNSSRDYHGALLDARILGDVYLAMTGGQISFDLGSELIETRKNHTKKKNNGKFVTQYADENELREHYEIIKEIDKASDGRCIWNISKF